MMNKLFFWCMILVVSPIISSYNSTAHNQTENFNELSVDDLLFKSNSFLYNQLDSTLFYAIKAVALSKKLALDSLLGESYLMASIAYYQLPEMQKAFSYLDSAEVVFREERNKQGIAEVYQNKALISKWNGDLESVINYLLESKNLFEELGNKKMTAKVTANIGNNFSLLKSYDQAREKYNEALTMFSSLENTNDKDIGGTYIALGNVHKELELYDSSYYYYQLANNIFSPGKNQLAQAYIYNNLGGLFELQNQPDSALFYYKASLKIKTELGHGRSIASTTKNISSLLRRLGKPELALNYLDKSYENILQMKDSFLTRDYYREYAAIYQDLGKFEQSTQFLFLFVELDGHLSGVERTKAISEIEAKYEKEKNEKLIANLELVNQRTTNKLNRIIFGVIILLLLVAFLLIYLVNRKRAGKLLMAKNQQITNALKDKEVLMKEIHHRVKNNLQTVSSLLKLQSWKSDDKVKDAIDAGQSRVKAMAIIHQMLYQENNLVSVDMLDYIKKLTSSILESFKKTDEDVQVHLVIKPLLIEVDSAISIGLIINELITNSLKYAYEKVEQPELNISLSEQNDSLNLIVQDNGIGFPEGFMMESQQSFGLNLVSMIAGKLEATINTTNKSGAIVQLIMKNYTLGS